MERWEPIPGEVRVARLHQGMQAVGWELRVPISGTDTVVGGGENFQTVDLSGTTRVLLNRELHGQAAAGLTYLNVPFFWCTAGWGLLIDTGGPMLMDIGQREPGWARFCLLGEELTATLLRGDPRTLLQDYTALTGRAGPWPEWAFGTWMSRASYMSEAELHAVIDRLQAAGCPVDVIHVDAWLAGNLFREFTCSWEVDRARFPAGWTERIRQRGVRTSLWLNPFVLADSPLERDLRQAHRLLTRANGDPAPTVDRPNRHIIDFTNPDAVGWWSDQVRRLLREERPDALKLDFGEEIPFDAICHDGRTGLEVRNVYAHLYQQATAAAIPAEHPPMALFCRSGTAGSQQTPCHWVGDTPSTWDGMAEALRACLSLSLSGFALVSHDAGGFHTPGSKAIPRRILDGEPARFTADVDPELYARWGQWAAFSPVTRFHGTGEREPTAYPDPWRSAVIAALTCRQSLRPLLLDALAEARVSGMPMMRPLLLTHPHEPAARRAWHQYLLGTELLVAPVLAPGGRTTIWFPEGSWEPLLGAPAIQRGGLHDISVGPDAFPVYRRRR